MFGPGFDDDLGGSFSGRLDAPAKLVIERASYSDYRRLQVAGHGTWAASKVRPNSQKRRSGSA
jgi:hypothetical protein